MELSWGDALPPLCPCNDPGGQHGEGPQPCLGAGGSHKVATEGGPYLDRQGRQGLPVGLGRRGVVFLRPHALRLQDVACPPIEGEQGVVHLHVLIWGGERAAAKSRARAGAPRGLSRSHLRHTDR